MTDKAKPTPGPWQMDEGNEVHRYGSTIFEWPHLGGGRSDAENAANMQFGMAACNSYAKHCSDPLEAAEGDLLGEALAALKAILYCWDGPNYRHIMGPNIDAARAILAKAEGKP